MDFQWYGSITGIVAFTVVLVQIAKNYLGDTAWLKSVPTWMYAVVISAILTEFCHMVLGTLPGDDIALLSQSVAYAALASGFKEWGSNINKPLSASSAAIAAQEEKK